MDDSDLDYQTFKDQLGSANPAWRLGLDSDVLELQAVHGQTDVALQLSREQAAKVRAMSAITCQLFVDVDMFGRQMRLCLVGRKINQQEWGGAASTYSDSNSVIHDLGLRLAFAESIVSEVNSLVAVLDRHGIVQRFNRKCEEVTGKREVDVVGKRAFDMFMNAEQGEASSRNVASFFANSKPFSVERLINTVNGPRLYEFRNKFVQSGSGLDELLVICSGTDITEERNAKQRLYELANTDELTGLPNRNAINEKIRAVLADRRDEVDQTMGVLFIDLDNFKKVNDRHGHLTGDQLLKKVSSVLAGCLPAGATLARLGGDEFLVFFERTTRAALDASARAIIEGLCIPFNVGLIQLYTNCSVGIAVYPQDGRTLEELVRNADTALYVAKDAGKRTYRFFTSEMSEKVAEHVWLDTNLRKALAHDQFVLHYQPIVDVATGELHGAEALVRWHSPERGLIAPREFIRFAEDSSLIIPLGRWVMNEAARQAARWNAKGLPVRVSVNLSARQLRDIGIVEHFKEAIDAAGLQPNLLDIELTESCFIDDEKGALTTMGRFRDIGARIHLDDFGTGYSSLAQLLRLPLDVIKLDRSFISGIDSNTKGQALVRSIVAVARPLGLLVQAEGVETDAEASVLRYFGVDLAQGYFYGRPMTAEAMEQWLDLRRSAQHA